MLAGWTMAGASVVDAGSIQLLTVEEAKATALVVQEDDALVQVYADSVYAGTLGEVVGAEGVLVLCERVARDVVSGIYAAALVVVADCAELSTVDEIAMVGRGLFSIKVLELDGLAAETRSVAEEETPDKDFGLVAMDTVGVTVTVRGGSVTVFGSDVFVTATVSYTTSVGAEKVEDVPPTSTTWYVAVGCGLGKALAG